LQKEANINGLMYVPYVPQVSLDAKLTSGEQMPTTFRVAAEDVNRNDAQTAQHLAV